MAKPKFNLGDVLRYRPGPTALLRVTYISLNHGGYGHRYYGEQCCGGSAGAYEDECSLASRRDMAEWEHHAPWRIHRFPEGSPKAMREVFPREKE